jgi:hypothetical protein
MSRYRLYMGFATYNMTYNMQADNFCNEIGSTILHKAHLISGRFIVVLDAKVVQALAINEEDAWFEQEVAGDAIILRLRRMSER